MRIVNPLSLTIVPQLSNMVIRQITSEMARSICKTTEVTYLYGGNENDAMMLDKYLNTLFVVMQSAYTVSTDDQVIAWVIGYDGKPLFYLCTFVTKKGNL